MVGAPIVVGLSAFHHDSAACVLRGADLVCAAEEERFTRIKHQGGLPVQAFRWCLEQAGLSIADIDAVAIGLDPDALAERRAAVTTASDKGDDALSEDVLRRILGVEAPIRFVEHHAAHAASAYLFSDMDEAAVLVVDGVGEWETTSIWRGAETELSMVASSRFPHSLGLFYSAVTSWLGFRVNQDEYKVMGLAGWGEPSLVSEFDRIVERDADGMPRLNMAYFGFVEEERMFSDDWLAVLGPARAPDEPLTSHHRNVAASAQRLIEDWMLALAELAHDKIGSKHLCVAGGVGLNAVANGHLARRGPFDRVFFQPVAGDAGTALGAAGVIMRAMGGPRPKPLTDLRLGPGSSVEEVAAVLDAIGIAATRHRTAASTLVDEVADMLVAGRVVGWFQGAAEFGPRALGARCILADPRSGSARDRINLVLKNRERWRPLAPVVAEVEASEFFEVNRPLRFMIETVAVRDGAGLDAITHIDGTARPQTVSPEALPRLSALLSAFKLRAGVPALISTSFNHASEPIVSTPAQALLAACRLGLDALVIEDFVVTDLRHDALDLVRTWQAPPALPAGANLYPL